MSPSPSDTLRRHAWLGVLALGAALFIAVERTLVATQNPNLVPSAILLGAAIVPAGLRRVRLRPSAALLRRRLRRSRPPRSSAA